MSIFARGGGGGGGGGESDSDSLFSGDAIEMVLGIAEGPIKGIKGKTVAEQLNNVFLDGTPVLSKTGDKLFKSSQLVMSYERGTPVTEIEDPEFGQTPIPFVLGGSSTPISIGQSLSQNIPVTQVTPTSFRNEYNKIEVRLLVSRLADITDKGAKELKARVRIRYKLTSETDWKDASITITGKTLSGGFVRSVDIYINNTDEDVQLEVTLLDVNDPETTTREIAWLAYELTSSLKYRDQSLKEYHPNTAMFHLVAKVGENFSRVPNITAVWQGLLCSVPSNYNSETRVYNEVMPWDGSFNVHKQFTSNPFWITRELILNPNYGMARYNPSVSIDDYSLYEEAKYADTLRVVGPVGQQKSIPLFSFNGVITRPMLGMELINYILGSANAQAVEYDSGYIRIVSDRNTESVCTVMPETCVQQHEDVTFTYNLTDIKDRFNEIITSYIEPEMDWQPQFVGPYSDPQAQIIQGVNLYEFEAIGCTNPYEAEYKAYFRLLTAQTETLSVTFSIPLTALSWDIFEIIDIVDPDMDWGLSGRIQSLVGLTVTLREPIYFEETGSYDFEVISKSGERIKRSFAIPVAGSYRQITLSSSISSALVPYAAFSITRDGFNPGEAKPFRVVSITPADGNPHIFTVTAIEVNRNKWAQALDSVIGKKPIYAYEQPRRPEAPSNLRLLEQHTLGSRRGSQDLVALTWDSPEQSFVGLAYVLQVSIDGGAFSDSGITRLNYTEYEVQPDIEYQFRISMDYQGQKLYSNILSYEIPDYSFSDFDLSKLLVTLNGEYRENDLYFDLKALYQFGGFGAPVDLLKTKKILAAEIEFYRVNSDNTQTFISRKTTTETENILLASEQLKVLDTVASEVLITARLVALDGSYFPSIAIVSTTQISNIPSITALHVEVKAQSIHASATLSHSLRRGMNLRWFLGKEASGLDRVVVGESSTLFGYTADPGTQYYLWCQPFGLYGNGAIYPEGNGQPLITGQFGGLTTYWLIRSHTVLQRDSDGDYDSPEITIKAQSQDSGGSVVPYFGHFKVFSLIAGVETLVYSSTAGESEKVLTVPVAVESLKIQLFDIEDNLLDQETTIILDEAVTYDLKVESTNGIIFRPGLGHQTLLKARIFKNSLEVTSEIPASRFRWRRVSLEERPFPNDDATWNSLYVSGYKELTITVDDVNCKATFHCDLLI